MGARSLSEFLKEVIDNCESTAEEFAGFTKIPVERMEKILQGGKIKSGEIDKLHRATKVPYSFWNSLEK